MFYCVIESREALPTTFFFSLYRRTLLLSLEHSLQALFSRLFHIITRLIIVCCPSSFSVCSNVALKSHSFLCLFFFELLFKKKFFFFTISERQKLLKKAEDEAEKEINAYKAERQIAFDKRTSEVRSFWRFKNHVHVL